jgi:hypothetical protein
MPESHHLYADLTVLAVRVLDTLFGLAVWSWLLGLLLGDKARQVIFAFWLSLARGIGNLLGAIARLSLSVIKRALSTR